MDSVQLFPGVGATSIIPPHMIQNMDVYEDKAHQQIEGLFLEQMFDYYNQTLKQSSRPLDFINRRIGIDNLSFIDRFNVGFVDRTLGCNLPSPKTEEGGAVRGTLQRLGLIKHSGHELFRGAIVFPLFDIHGRFIGVYGVWIGNRPCHVKTHHLIWKKKAVGIFNWRVLKDYESIILCRTPIEASRLWSKGFRNALSVMGSDKFSRALEYVVLNSCFSSVEVFVSSESDKDWGAQTQKQLKLLNIDAKQTSISDYPAC